MLETVVGTEEGRQCVLDEVNAEIQEGTPAGSEVTFAVDELAVPGADVGMRVTADINAGGITAAVFIDIIAARQGDCTVFGTYQSFNDPFDEDLQAQLFGAALAEA